MKFPMITTLKNTFIGIVYFMGVTFGFYLFLLLITYAVELFMVWFIYVIPLMPPYPFISMYILYTFLFLWFFFSSFLFHAFIPFGLGTEIANHIRLHWIRFWIKYRHWFNTFESLWCESMNINLLAAKWMQKQRFKEKMVGRCGKNTNDNKYSDE